MKIVVNLMDRTVAQVEDDVLLMSGFKVACSWDDPDGTWYTVLVNEAGQIKVHHWPAEEVEPTDENALAYRMMDVKEELIGYETKAKE